jgi:hypothetical protein
MYTVPELRAEFLSTLPRNDNCSGNPAFQRQANTCSVLFLHDLHNDRLNHLRKILAFGRCVQEKVVRLGGTCLKSLVMTWAGKARTQTRLEGRVRKLVRSSVANGGHPSGILSSNVTFVPCNREPRESSRRLGICKVVERSNRLGEEGRRIQRKTICTVHCSQAGAP